MTHIPFNKPYMTGKGLGYIAQAHANTHFADDGKFTKKCHTWLEAKTSSHRALLRPRGADVVFTLVISAFILTMLSLGNGKLSIELILFCTFVCAVLTKAGELTLRICRLTGIKAWLPMAFVVGFVAISLPMMALTLTINMSVLTAFWISALSVLSLHFFASRRTAARSSIDWADTAIALALAIIIGFLAKTPVSSLATLLNTGVLPIWSDYFLHGVTIASFGSPFTFGGDMELAGVSRVFYHYAPFMIPAAFQTVSGMSGLALSISLLLPLGLLIAALGSYAFAVELGGRLGGLLALTAIIGLPAPLVFFIQSGWFDFYWMLFSSPGAGYAIGVSAVVCASTMAYFKNIDSSIFWFTMLLLFSLVLIRVHMFMLLASAILAVILLHRLRANIWLLLWAVISAITIGILALYFSTHLHTLWMEYANPKGYLNLAFQWMPISIYGHQITFLEYPLGLTMFAQLLIVLAAVLGIYFILYPLLLRLSVRRFGFHATDALPFLLVMSFIGLMLFAPAPSINGDLSEYKHRHFPLLYVITVIYTITYACALASNRMPNENKSRQLVYNLVISIIAAIILLSWGLNLARPYDKAMPWARYLENTPVTPGLLEASQYIGTHAQQGDVLAMGGSSPAASGRNVPIDVVVSLTGVPAFIARSDLKMNGSQCAREIAMKRLSLLQELSSMTNWPDAQNFLQTNGIRWFLVPSGEKPKWNPNLEFAVFSINGFSVYDAGHSASELFKKLQC